MGKWAETKEAYYGRPDSSEENTGRVLPILFNTEMVRAILDGRKTVTRRVMKPQPLYYTGRRYLFADEDCQKKWEDCDNIIETYQYQPGDILYVRETWAFIPCIECTGSDCCYKTPSYYEDKEVESIGCYIYRSGFPEYADSKRITWRPSIHMPKEAARIWLKVTDVRVERLMNMTEQQAEAEGIHFDDCPAGYTWKSETDIHNCYTNPVAAMAALWNKTLTKEQKDRFGWDANPWVWVIEFERCKKPRYGR